MSGIALLSLLVRFIAGKRIIHETSEKLVKLVAMYVSTLDKGLYYINLMEVKANEQNRKLNNI